MGAGGGARAVAEQLAFLSDSGASALEGLVRQLERRGLRAEDLLRLRAFVATSARASMFLRELEQLLPRERWPALTVIVQTPTGGGQAHIGDRASTGGGHIGDRASTGARIGDRASTGGGQGRAGVRASAVEGEAVDAIAAVEAGRRRMLSDGTVRFDDWVFLGAVRGDGRGIERQARSVFEHMRAALAHAGARPRHVVKVGGWLGFAMSDYGPLGALRSELLIRDELFPASAAVQVRAPAADDDSRLLAFEAIAFTGNEQQRAVGRVSPLASYYATTYRAGEYVFTCGEIPRRRAPVEEQLHDVYEQLREHLHDQDATLAGTRAQTIYVRSDQDPNAVAYQLRSLPIPASASTTVVTVSDLGFRPGVDVEVELIAQAGT